MTVGTPPLEFQQVLSLQQKGDFAGAMLLCRQIMQQYPRHPAAFQFAAMVQCQDGKLEEGVALLRQAINLGADNASMRYNLAKALYQLGNLEDAENACQKALADNPNAVNVLCLYGDIQKAGGQLAAAADTYRHALHIQPKTLQAWNNLGNALRVTRQFKEAITALDTAVTLSPDTAQLHFNLGNAFKDAGNYPEAAQSHKRACDLDPDNAEALSQLGEAMIAMGLQSETATIFGRVVELQPDNSNAHFNLGIAVAMTGDAPASLVAFRRAIELQPELWPAHFNLISQLEKTSQLEEMEAALNHVEATLGEDPTIPVLRASLFKRQGRFEEARDLLSVVNENRNPETSLLRATLMGQVSDRLGDSTAAFAAFVEMNEAEARRPYAARINKQAYLDHISFLETQITPEVIASWNIVERDTKRTPPAFLVGFPRSGTTLLDTMLRSHGEIGVLEEVPIIENVLEKADRATVYGPATDDQMTGFRSEYFDQLNLNTEGTFKSLWIDKLPLNMVEAGVIHRLFPEAKFIFALRHPCDAVLSCFMQQFALNDAMVNFTTIEDAAHLYDRAMGMWLRYTELLPLQVYHVRYEELVSAPKETLSPLLEFLGVEWRDSVLDHQSTATKRTNINTPSYHQVTEELYTHAAGRWKRYREQMASVLPLITPWAERFDYNV